jgi:ABC-type glycerol-3-phosphate transport system permease component
MTTSADRTAWTPGRVIRRIVRYLLLTALSVTIVYPIGWMILTSLRDNGHALSDPFGLSGSWGLDNYVELVTNGSLLDWVVNSVLVNVCSVVGIVVLSALMAYAFSAFDFRGKNALFVLLIVGLTVPPQALVVAGYRWISLFALENSYLGLIVTYCGWTSFGVLVLRRFFDSVPSELREAAIVDGASHMRILWRILLPLARPSVVTVTIFSVVWVWNDFVYPLVYVQNQDMYTLPVGVLQFTGRSTSQIAVQMGVLTVATALPLLVYFLFRKQFVRGLLEGAVKG